MRVLSFGFGEKENGLKVFRGSIPPVGTVASRLIISLMYQVYCSRTIKIVNHYNDHERIVQGARRGHEAPTWCLQPPAAIIHAFCHLVLAFSWAHLTIACGADESILVQVVKEIFAFTAELIENRILLKNTTCWMFYP
jgi:hypothetical protein